MSDDIRVSVLGRIPIYAFVIWICDLDTHTHAHAHAHAHACPQKLIEEYGQRNGDAVPLSSKWNYVAAMATL